MANVNEILKDLKAVRDHLKTLEGSRVQDIPVTISLTQHVVREAKAKLKVLTLDQTSVASMQVIFEKIGKDLVKISDSCFPTGRMVPATAKERISGLQIYTDEAIATVQILVKKK